MNERPGSGQGSTSLPAVLALTFLCSLGTGVFWHGVPFIAKHTYGFGQTRNLVLYAVMGAIYTLGAFGAGPMTRRLERWVTTRGILAVTVSVQALLCLGPVVFRGQWALWLAVIGVTFLSSIIWPVIESYLTAGRHGPSMRSAIGWFNLTWAPAIALPLLLMAPFLEKHGEWTIGGFTVANVLALVALARFAPRPGHHDPDLADAHVAPEYPFLLRSARVLLPLSYVLNAAMNPILPYRFEALNVAVWWETPATATWTIVRVAAFLLMWRLRFWHGRWGTLVLGAAAMTGGFALVVLGPSLPLMLAGFGCLGVGLGVIYNAALYYAMSVGRARVEAGGTHEGLIGAGYAVGPLAGLAGIAIAGGPGVVAVVWGILALAGIPALRPYRDAVKRRAISH
ncbi:MAG: MFS transporter [Planctomycetota bacterium]